MMEIRERERKAGKRRKIMKVCSLQLLWINPLSATVDFRVVLPKGSPIPSIWFRAALGHKLAGALPASWGRLSMLHDQKKPPSREDNMLRVKARGLRGNPMKEEQLERHPLRDRQYAIEGQRKRQENPKRIGTAGLVMLNWQQMPL